MAAVPWYRSLYVLCFIAAAIIDTTVIWNIAYVVVALVTIPNLFAMFLLRNEMREHHRISCPIVLKACTDILGDGTHRNVYVP